MSTRVVLALRVVLLLLAAGAATAALALHTRHGRHAGSFACPMHPQAVAEAPGSCPICGMALALVGSAQGDRSYPAQLLPTPGEISLARRGRVTDAVQAPAWFVADGVVAALLYNEDVDALAADERGSFVPAAPRSAAFTVVRQPTPTRSAWDPSTSTVLFRSVGRNPELSPGDVGRLVLSPGVREVLLIPAAAVLRAREGAYVLAAQDDGHTFARRPVVLGKMLKGFAVVLSGVRDQEHIVVRDAFFLDAERRLQAGED